MRRRMRIVGVVGHSGMGKTSLLERLVPELVRRGLTVSLVKHSHKPIDVDHPGKDSHRLREAGCDDVVIVGRDRWAVVHELRDAPQPELEEIMAAVRPCDVLLVEGMKGVGFPKIEVWRPSIGRPPLWPTRGGIVAVATDDKAIRFKSGPTTLDVHDASAVCDFVLSLRLPSWRAEGPAWQQSPAGAS